MSIKKIDTSQIIFITIILTYLLSNIIFWITNTPIIPQGESIHHFRQQQLIL